MNVDISQINNSGAGGGIGFASIGTNRTCILQGQICDCDTNTSLGGAEVDTSQLLTK
jgi:glycerate kinase